MVDSPSRPSPSTSTSETSDNNRKRKTKQDDYNDDEDDLLATIATAKNNSNSNNNFNHRNNKKELKKGRKKKFKKDKVGSTKISSCSSSSGSSTSSDSGKGNDPGNAAVAGGGSNDNNKMKKEKKRRISSDDDNDDVNVGDDDDRNQDTVVKHRVTPNAIDLLVSSGRVNVPDVSTHDETASDEEGEVKNVNDNGNERNEIEATQKNSSTELNDRNTSSKKHKRKRKKKKRDDQQQHPQQVKTTRIELPVILTMRLHHHASRSTTAAGTNDTTTTTTTTNRQDVVFHDGGDDSLFATVEDDRHSLDVVVMNIPPSVICDVMDASAGEYEYMIAVDGYTTTGSRGVKYHLVPLVCITSFRALYRHRIHGQLQKQESSFALSSPPRRQRQHRQHLPTYTPAKVKGERAHCGSVGSFLSQTLAFFTNDELLGSAQLFHQHHPSTSLSSSPSLTLDLHEDLAQVKKFMSHHNAMVTLQTSTSPPKVASVPSTGTGTGTTISSTSTLEEGYTVSEIPPSPPQIKRPTEQALDLYESALREFKTSQMARAMATLGTNTGKEPADRATLVAQRHNSTLEIAMKETRPLSVGILCEWHKELLRDIDPDRAGQIRKKSARAGSTYFARPESIHTELELLCNALSSLEKRLDLKHNVRHSLLFAAVAMYGVVEIHPFSDGNGRLSRIVCNWALRQRLPFPINLFATPSQRTEYVVALETTRHRLSLRDWHGHVSQDDILRAMKTTGLFSALVNLLSSRIAKTTHEWERLLDEKNGLAAETAECQAARRVREKAARGTCIICLEEKPNIATLCCGKPIHLNCIAEWLANQQTCPICRAEMPRVPRVIRPTSRSERRYERERAIESDETRMPAADQDDEDDDPFDEEDTNSTSSSLPPSVSRRRDLGAEDNFFDTVRYQQQLQRLILDSYASSADIIRQASRAQLGREEEGARSTEDLETTTSTSSTSDDDNAEDVEERQWSDADTTTSVSASGSEEDETEDDDNEWGEGSTSLVEADYREPDFGDNDETTETTVIAMTNSLHPSDETYHSAEPVQRESEHTMCSHHACRNRAAVDCCCSMCGRCCVLYGQFHCPRHNA